MFPAPQTAKPKGPENPGAVQSVSDSGDELGPTVRWDVEGHLLEAVVGGRDDPPVAVFLGC